MKKRPKAVFGFILAAALLGAAEARAEITIGVGIEGYIPAANARAVEMRAAQLERLSGTVVSLNESAGRDAGKTEVLLAGLYAGSVNSEAAPAVYREANRAPAVNKAARFCLPAFDKPADEEAGAAAKDEVKPEAKPEAGVAGVKDGKEEAAVAAEEKPDEAAGAAAEAKPASDKAAGFWGALCLVLLLLLFLL